MTNIMVDIETLGVGAGAHIVSIGAYCLETEMAFYIEVRNDKQFRNTDMSTLLWWMQQSEGARRVFFLEDSKKPELGTALAMFAEFYSSQGGTAIWCKGLTFDIPILEDAMKQCGLTAPWDFRAPRCWRTLKESVRGKFDIPTSWVEGAQHNALFDAKIQGLQLAAVLEWLAGKEE